MKSTSLSDFKKEKIIGKGSFGSVYLVRRLLDNKKYALKTVILDKLNKKEQENSVNEVRILASIKNPFVIGYKEAFWDDNNNTLNIVMEYADDGDLQTKIRKMRNEGGFFKENLIWEYAIQMIKGLKSLHDKKIMHRDLKSANIFLFKKDHICKLGDLNVSKVIKDKVLLTQTGTPYYASPEVWRDESYSYKSDLWSIGCVIYELCEQHPPFMGKNLDELFEDVCKGKPKRINKIYSDELWKIIMMLLQTNVDKRVDCDEFLNNKIVKDKINEIKLNKKLNIDNNNNNNGDNKLLNTIKFNNLNDLKYQLPSTKNYDYLLLNDNKENISDNNNIKIKNNKDTSKNKLKTEENNNIINKKRNKIILEKIKEMQIKNNNNNNNKLKLNIKKLFLIKKRSKKEEQLNIEPRNIVDKLVYNNKSKILDKNNNKNIINKIKIKGKIKDNLIIKIPKNKYIINKSSIPIINNINISNVITPSIKLYKENKPSKINYNNNEIIQSIPISISTSNINKNQDSLSINMSQDYSKHIDCITQITKNENKKINLIPICQKRNKKEDIKRKIKTKLIKRKNTYSKERKEKKEKKIIPLLIKRNNSLDLETFLNINIKKPKHKKNNLSLNSLNMNNNIYYLINKNDINDKNQICKKYYHKRYPTISSVQYSILNNFNKYNIISSSIRNKKGNNHITLSNHLHKNLNILTNNIRNNIKYRKINPNIKRNERKVNSFVNINEKRTNKSGIYGKINNKRNKTNNSIYYNENSYN